MKVMVIEPKHYQLKNLLVRLDHIQKTSFNLELLEGSEFVFNYVHLLYYQCHKINLIHGGSDMDLFD